MAKRGNNGRQDQTAENKKPMAGTANTADVEDRVVAFAEQLGRIAGTVQARAEGWMDRETLKKQISGVRDSAAELLDQLKTTVAGATPANGKTAAAAKVKSKGRSGGVVDAPGKKHRKPMPADPRALAGDAKRLAMRSSQASMKTTKRRGRG